MYAYLNYMFSSLLFHLQIIIANKTLSSLRRLYVRQPLVVCHLHNASLNSLDAILAERENCIEMIQGDEVDIALLIIMHRGLFTFAGRNLRSRAVCCLFHPMSLEALNLHSSERQTNN